MTSVLRELPRSHPVEDRRCGAASAEAGTPATAVRGSPTSPTLRVRLHLKPGQKGTKQLLAQYGDRLVCVRDRYDAQRRTRFKTAQIIVAEREWEPPPPPFAQHQFVALRVAFAEVAVREQVKQAWNPQRKVWLLR